MQTPELRVLAIDDQPDNLTTLNALLKEAFPTARVLTATSGPAGIERALAEDPDVILLDVVMPRMDGFEVCRTLKTEASTRDTPVVFLTALRANRELRVKALECGGDAFLSKPIDEIELVAQVRAMAKIKAANGYKGDEARRLAGLVAERTRELEQSRTAALSLLDDLRAENETRKKVEAELLASSVLNRQVIASASEGIIVYGPDLRYLVWNRFMESLTGVAASEVLGRLPHEVFPFLKDAGVLQRLQGALADATPEPVMFPFDINGRRGWALDTSSPLRNDSDEIVGVIATVQDVTERKQVEERLRESEEYLSNIINTIGDPVFVKDEQFRFVLVNDAMCTFLGRARGEIIGTTGMEYLPADEMEHFLSVDRRVLASGAPDACEETVSSGDREARTVLTTKTRHVDRGGSKFLVGVIRDMTEHKRADAARQKLEQQLQVSQRMEAIGSLAGGVAHDFNNLLSVILSYTCLAIETLTHGDPLRDDLLQVKRGAERAAVLTRQLLAFGRRQIMQPVSLDLNATVTEIEKMLRRILSEDIDLVQVLAEDLGVVRADPGQIEQVLMNLVVNARDAMPEGGKLTIETSNVEVDEAHAARHRALTPGPYVRLAVTDTGCGMDAPTQERIFEPFFTTKRRDKGTGLGLSTVYGIVKQSGGDIWVYSEPGLGTTLKIYFPRQLLATPTTRTTRKTPTAVTRITGIETILVVEDEDALREVARRSLEAAGYAVFIAADGEQALRTAARCTAEIHLLLTDVVMPRMGGQALALELVKTRPNTKVLYMSGYADHSIVQQGRIDEGTNFIGKPFTGADLTRKVRAVLDADLESPAEGPER